MQSKPRLLFLSITSNASLPRDRSESIRWSRNPQTAGKWTCTFLIEKCIKTAHFHSKSDLSLVKSEHERGGGSQSRMNFFEKKLGKTRFELQRILGYTSPKVKLFTVVVRDVILRSPLPSGAPATILSASLSTPPQSVTTIRAQVTIWRILIPRTLVQRSDHA